MFTRLAIILTFALQPLWLNGGIVRAQVPAECAVITCCETIKIVSCCGEETVEIVCSETGSECVCVAEPETPRQPSPVPPQRNSSEWMPDLTLRATGVVIDWPEMPRFNVRAVSRIHARVSHNMAQAITGVWLT